MNVSKGMIVHSRRRKEGARQYLGSPTAANVRIMVAAVDAMWSFAPSIFQPFSDGESGLKYFAVAGPEGVVVNFVSPCPNHEAGEAIVA